MEKKSDEGHHLVTQGNSWRQGHPLISQLDKNGKKEVWREEEKMLGRKRKIEEKVKLSPIVRGLH